MYRAYLLHRTPYSNSSLLLECFTREHGRFPAIAKGARSGRKSGQAALQPFNPLIIRTTGKGEVKTLSGYELDGTGPGLHGKGMYCGFYLNELLVRILARNDPHEGLFTHYENALIALSSTDNIEPALRQFEVALLDELGYGLQLEVDVEAGNPIKPDAYYSFELESGARLAQPSDHNSIMGSTLLALAGNRTFEDIEKNQARLLMRRVLAHYLGERPLKSRELFTQHFRE
ncbi:MAG: DNA repair protein RecO [Gammaproteobacteria bacterium]|nr:DNA repair protein RecO [Gammaproteobacteria bacterium]